MKEIIEKKEVRNAVLECVFLINKISILIGFENHEQATKEFKELRYKRV